MYEQVAQRYLLDDDVAEFMTRSNPWAARAIAERLLEAADRGMWASPEADTLVRHPRSLPRARGRARGGGRVSPPYPAHGDRRPGGLIEALLINAVSPEVGGVLVRGERGTAKSTAVRGLAPLLAAGDRRQRPGVRVRARRARARRARRGRRRGRAAAGLARRAAARREPRPARRRARPGSRAERREGLRGRPAGARAPGASSTSTRSTCCPTTSSTRCSTRRPRASRASSATLSRPCTTRASCSSAR